MSCSVFARALSLRRLLQNVISPQYFCKHAFALQCSCWSGMLLLVRCASFSSAAAVHFPDFLTRGLLLRRGEVRIRGSLECACGEMVAVGFQKCGKWERATPEGFRTGAKWERQSGVFVAGWSPGCQNRMFWEERATPECMQDANLVEVGICLLPLRPKTERLQAIWKAKRSKGECGEHCEGGSGEGRRLVLSSARFDQVPLGPNNLPTYRASLALMERPLRLGIACFRSAAYFGRGRLSPRKHNLFRSALSQNTKTAPISENH